MPMRNATRTALLATLPLACVFASSRLLADDPHGGHGVGHEQLHHWYLTLRAPGTGMPCCSNKDCRPTRSRIVQGVVQVEVDGEWTPVPVDKILSTPSPDLQSHVCAPKHRYPYTKGYIFCVILGMGA